MGDIRKRIRRLPSRRDHGQPRGYRPGPFALVYSALLAAGLVAAAGVYYMLLHYVPGMAANRADTVKTALLVIGGSGALAGLYVAYRKQRTDEANHLRDQDKLFTERYTAAAAQLGHDKAAVRLAGVYALARIADDSERDRPTCLEVLCAYLRMPYDPDDPVAEPAERQVRTTAQDAIAARLRTGRPGFWPYASVDLTGAYLIDPRFDDITAASFTAIRATFSGTASFYKATFGAMASFKGAAFNGDARFDKATLGGAFVLFDGATFGGLAAFGQATFGDHVWFGKATFSGKAWFDKATFSGDAWFESATFNRDAKFDGATFNGDAMFEGATFSQAHAPVWPGGSPSQRASGGRTLTTRWLRRPVRIPADWRFLSRAAVCANFPKRYAGLGDFSPHKEPLTRECVRVIRGQHRPAPRLFRRKRWRSFASCGGELATRPEQAQRCR